MRWRCCFHRPRHHRHLLLFGKVLLAPFGKQSHTPYPKRPSIQKEQCPLWACASRPVFSSKHPSAAPKAQDCPRKTQPQILCRHVRFYRHCHSFSWSSYASSWTWPSCHRHRRRHCHLTGRHLLFRYCGDPADLFQRRAPAPTAFRASRRVPTRTSAALQLGLASQWRLLGRGLGVFQPALARESRPHSSPGCSGLHDPRRSLPRLSAQSSHP
mmetsp:Transcript_3712/g.9359  ORF Transcript_3712/g.9359 Transcript_3712/m.9359 type:complete len:213 (-) Transcript_3712:65-703(-)